MSRSVRVLVRSLQAHGYLVAIVSACEAPGPLIWPGDEVDLDELVIVRKPNLGYDFGSWSIGLDALPDALSAPRVLLLNDSMAGPFTSLEPLLDQFDSTKADVWGLTDSYQFGHHLQSYCLGFTDGILQDRPLREFWDGVQHETDKDEIIRRNELGISRLLCEEGYAVTPAFAFEHVVAPSENPVIIGWRRLLQQGFPFVKREILRTPGVAPGGVHAPRVLRELFDVDVWDWVEDRAL